MIKILRISQRALVTIKAIVLVLFLIMGVEIIKTYGDFYDYIHLACSFIIIWLLAILIPMKVKHVFFVLFFLIVGTTFVDSINRVSGYPDRRYVMMELFSTILYLGLFILPWILKEHFCDYKKHFALALVLNVSLIFPIWLLPATLVRNYVVIKNLPAEFKLEPFFVSKIFDNLIWTVDDKENVRVFKAEGNGKYSILFQTTFLDGRGSMEAQGLSSPWVKTSYLFNSILKK